jgi:hypothetical protein
MVRLIAALIVFALIGGFALMALYSRASHEAALEQQARDHARQAHQVIEEERAKNCQLLARLAPCLSPHDDSDRLLCAQLRADAGCDRVGPAAR